MYIGPAVVTGEWLALIGVAMAALAYGRKIGLEEATLEVAFGADYDAYRRATWALVPDVEQGGACGGDDLRPQIRVLDFVFRLQIRDRLGH